MISISSPVSSRVWPAFPSLKRPVGAVLSVILLSALAACGTTSNTIPTAQTPRKEVQAPSDPYRIVASNKLTPPHMEGRQIVRVALLAPFSSENAAIRDEAQTLQSAAELAIFEHGDNTMLLMPKDSGDTAESAREAAKDALQGGADFILGPLFASGVSTIAPYARTNNVPMFSFSTDTSEAGRGIYVLTFLPEDEAKQIVSYALGQGVKRLAIIAPAGRYGDRVIAAAREVAQEAGIVTLEPERYDPRAANMASAVDAAKRLAQVAADGPPRETALLIPERGALLRTLVATLNQNGASNRQVRLLGTGLWNDAETLGDPRLAGGWYVTPDVAARSAFEQRFQQAYRRRPTRLAGMAYDATALLARMTRGGSKSGATSRAIETPEGFVGVDGLFRFRRNIIERGMSINEVSPRGSRVIQVAPKTFTR